MVGLGVIALLTLATVWYGLMVKVKALRAAQRMADNGFRMRHDWIPLLVERVQAAGPPQGGVVEKLIAQRSEARLERDIKAAFKKEERLEAALKQVMKEGQKVEALGKDLGWLEARTELQKTTEAIGEALEQVERARGVLAAELLRFPARLFRGVVKRYL